MSKAKRGRDEGSKGLLVAQMELGTSLMLAPFRLNPFLGYAKSSEDEGLEERRDEWRFATTRRLEKLVEEGVLEEPEKYGFSDFREMKRFLKGRHEESNNSFRSSRSDRKELNAEAPSQASVDQAMKSFTSVFHPEAEEVQRMLESTDEAEYWELADTMADVVDEYGRLVTDGEAQINLKAGEEELVLRFKAEDGIYPKTIEALYRTGEETYLHELDDWADLPEELDSIPEIYES
jgi:hypothetical protein